MAEHLAAHLAALRPDAAAVRAAMAVSGRAALAAILPHECIEEHPERQRRYDAALLFLIYPPISEILGF